MSILALRIGTPVIITVLSTSCRVIKPLVDHVQVQQWLLQELNGAHLRLSASVVCCNITSEKKMFSFVSRAKYILSIVN